MKTKLLAMCIIALSCLISQKNSFAQIRDAGGASDGNSCILENPPESFKRNNGDGTCGKDGQIRLKFKKIPGSSPILIDLIYEDGSPVTDVYLPIEGDDSELAKKKYVSYCILGANLIPAKKLIARFRYPNSCQGDITLYEQ